MESIIKDGRGKLTGEENKEMLQPGVFLYLFQLLLMKLDSSSLIRSAQVLQGFVYKTKSVI